MDFGYRHSILQSGRYILLEAEFELNRAKQEAIKELMGQMYISSDGNML